MMMSILRGLIFTSLSSIPFASVVPKNEFAPTNPAFCFNALNFPRPVAMSPLSAKLYRSEHRSKAPTMVARVPVSRLMVQWQEPDALGGFGAVYFAETTDGDQVLIFSFWSSRIF
jgi:hypothetical protein